jgi:hypothetical protein
LGNIKLLLFSGAVFADKEFNIDMKKEALSLPEDLDYSFEKDSAPLLYLTCLELATGFVHKVQGQ